MLANKLHPTQFSDMSPKLGAIVACILGENWTSPRLSHLSITSDGFVLSGHNFLGSAYDLGRNIDNLLEVADLTKEETRVFWELYACNVTDWRDRNIK